jgi:hypothetical protein
LSNIVLVKTAVSYQLLAISQEPSLPAASLTPPERVWVLLNPESCKLQIASNPMFDANISLTPNIKLALRILVELTGIEPVASWLQTRRSPS